jgi:hypothetical protein
MPQLPTFMHVDEERLRKAKRVLPKFHIYNHGLNCILNYSLNFLHWSAASDLEDPERWWAHINPVSMSTKEMSEGSCHDTIDDHACSWNWRKITGFGMSSLPYAVSFIDFVSFEYRPSFFVSPQEGSDHAGQAQQCFYEIQRYIPSRHHQEVGEDG